MESPTLQRLLAERDALNRGRGGVRAMAPTSPANSEQYSLAVRSESRPLTAQTSELRQSAQPSARVRSRSVVLPDVPSVREDRVREAPPPNAADMHDELLMMRMLLEKDELRGRMRGMMGMSDSVVKESGPADPNSAKVGLPPGSVFPDYRPESGFKLLWDRMSGMFNSAQSLQLVAALGEYDAELDDHPSVQSNLVRFASLLLLACCWVSHGQQSTHALSNDLTLARAS
jgi:hypothetical protein